MHTVEGTDPRLHTEIFTGTGRPVLLLHGFGSSAQLNWHNTGWVAALLRAGRTVITVDLPGHGRSAVPDDIDSYSPSRIRADLLQLITDDGVRPLKAGDPASGLDVLGYSLGARLAWEFGATQPDLVHRMVLGGAAATDPLADFDLAAARRQLADGSPIGDQTTAEVLRMARAAPSFDAFALLSMVSAIRMEPFSPDEAVPHMPLLLVAGDRDPLAATMARLAELSGRAQIHWLPGRGHADAVTSRAFKDAAIAFLAED